MDPKKFGAIVERPDLFETKFLQITPATQVVDGHKFFFASRDPGSAAALIPVMKMLSQRGDQLTCVTDGRAEEAITKEFATTDLTAQDKPVLATDLPESEIMVVDPSFSEFGLDTFTAAQDSNKPFVLVEDAYATANRFLAMLQKKDLRFPDRICVLDEAAKEIIVQVFPQLAEHIVVTGQPAFDQFAHEDTQSIAAAARAKLQLAEDVRVIAVMATPNEGSDFVEHLAQGLAAANNGAVIFRRHPRDNTSADEYANIFARHGITLVDSTNLTTAQVGALADCIVTTTSVEGLHALYRRKPTVYCFDPKYVAERPGLVPPPPVTLGAAFGVSVMDQFSGVVTQALSASQLHAPRLYDALRQHYPVDGKNTQRVVAVIDSFLA